MITRIWRGWATLEKAAAYESLLLNEIFPHIASRNVAGYKGISLLKSVCGDEVEFVTIMWFDSIEAVKKFAGDDYEVAVVPAKARQLLKRFDAKSAHYQALVRPPASAVS